MWTNEEELTRLDGYIEGVLDGQKHKIAFGMWAVDIEEALADLSNAYPWGTVHLVSACKGGDAYAVV